MSQIVLLFGISAAPSYAHTGSLPWNFEPWIVIAIALAAWSYGRGVLRLWKASDAGRGVSRYQAGAYAAGVVFLVVALISPLDALGDRSFAAHMLQHEVLMLLAAPLLVLGRPLGPYLWAMPIAWRRRLGTLSKSGGFSAAWQTLTYPAVAWTLHAVALWVWHAPSLFQWAWRDDTAHTLQHLSFLGSALIFWWTLFNRRAESAGVGAAVFYLFTTALHTSLLGALLTFSNSIWYLTPTYDDGRFGLSALEDQQLGGLIMWIPGGTIYLVAALALMARSLTRPPRLDAYE